MYPIYIHSGPLYSHFTCSPSAPVLRAIVSICPLVQLAVNNCVCVCLQVARKLLIIEGDHERTEERAELAEA